MSNSDRKDSPLAFSPSRVSQREVSGDKDVYDYPLITRYSSPQMSKIWSPQNKFETWRRLWVALATVQRSLGLDISQAQIDNMQANIQNIDFEYAERKEKELRHDVMSHVHAFGKECPEAYKIIHLGATSCFVTDNTELIQMRDSLKLMQARLLRLLQLLSVTADKYKDIPTLGFTHYQPAQLTTVGKRICLWLQDFAIDFEEITRILDNLPFRGVKGTTGTQASFMELFNGNHEKVKKLDVEVTKMMGFRKSLPICSQTYTRKIDFLVLSALAGIAQSAHKMGTDIRLLANLKEMEEPFGKNQVGSSAMAYKRNPMRCERMCSIARYAMNLLSNCAQTHSLQWLERTLDDSANRRMVLPEMFLCIDGILSIASNVIDGIQVWPLVIRKHVMAELPFMATENILMACVKAGGDRQLLHERIREHSMAAGLRVKQQGEENDLLSRIAKDQHFVAIHAQLDSITDPSKYVGRAPQQVSEYLASEIQPLFEDYTALLAADIQTDVVRV